MNTYLLFYLTAILPVILSLYVIYRNIYIVEEDSNAIVARFGRFRRFLKPGINFLSPFLDKVVFKESLRERLLRIRLKDLILQDDQIVEVSVVLYWEIFDVYRVYYDVSNVEDAIAVMCKSLIRSAVCKYSYKELQIAYDQINENLIGQGKFDSITSKWGVRITLMMIENIERNNES